MHNYFLQAKNRPFFAAVVVVLTIILNGCQFPGLKKTSPVPPHNPCVVLALPASGGIAPIAAKIKNGATLAKEALKKQGISVIIENVDTQAPDWLTKLEALPAYCVVVGGPLQDKTYLEARNSRAVDRRIFFSFVPNLAKGDEGKIAWRFFPSPHDQIEALTDVGINKLNIHSYGAFYPTDSYGPRMTQILEDELSRKNMTLTKASYNPSSPSSWSDAAAVLIKPGTATDGKTPVPQTAFEALFLPDSWKHMDMLTQSLLYNGEDRLVLLGTTLWEQGLSGKRVNKINKYALAIFPAAWDSSRAPKDLQKPGNDFWVALGYDFINFAVNSGLDQRLDAQQVTKKAQQAASSIRAMAPILWDNNGIARQKLYLFQVAPNGMTPLDLSRFNASRTSIMENAALRMQGHPETDEDLNPNQIVTPAQANDPVQLEPSSPMPKPAIVKEPIQATPAPAVSSKPLSTTPQPSYKLRLPTRQ